MRLLVLTQKVDREDPVLGFFHNWLIKLALKFESVVVICLGKGIYDLPDNVRVLSLGKEAGVSKFRYIYNFYKYIWSERGNYDSVFVHMNEEYVYLGWKSWFILGKKIYMWRNHKKGNFLTWWAVFISTKVFYTSPESYTARFKKSVQMPVGIDTEIFKDQKLERKKNSILSIGRISPVKNVHLMLEVARVLKDGGVDFVLDIVGDPVNPEDFEYKNKLVESNKDLIDSGLVNFLPSVPNYKTPELYAKHEFFLNLTPSGSFDKTILEAVSCGAIPVVANEALKEVFDINMVSFGEVKDVANKIEFWLKAEEGLKQEWRSKLSNYVLENHSLNALMDKLCIIIKE